MPTKDKDLEPVNDLKMVQRYLRYGLEFHELVSCYIEDSNLRFDAFIKAVDIDKLALDMEITDECFAKLDSNQISAIDRPQSEIRLSYSVNEATFFVHAKFQRRNIRNMAVKADMPMYKLQRREALRIKVMASHKATVRLGPTVFPLFDISAGGLSVVVGINEEKDFKKQQLFPGSMMTFLGKEIKVDLEVKNVLPADKSGVKWKVGFRFKGLPGAIEQMIAREAYLHTHKIWSRFL
ncbi:MAG TPA: PilZ domain-containing protein [Bdellovibrionota bacterium]|jgi:c-di-GMP-binding flagellar brake protein YcgR